MKLIPLLIVILLWANLGHSAIYRYVDEAGNVTFTSEPPPGTQADPVQLRDINAVERPKPSGLDLGSSDSSATEHKGYSLLAITQPEDGAALRSNAGNISINLSVDPQLAPNHQVVLFLDGQEVARSATTVFALENIDRGTHVLSASVKDAKGKTLIKASPVTFHILRVSAITSP